MRFDESENYWFMIKGGAGPCGPNSEIYYDFGASIGCGQPDCSPPTHDCGRFLEIWNLVFMALYQEEDGKTRRPLPQKNVDTGAGLERWSPVLLWQNQVDWQGNPKQWDEPAEHLRDRPLPTHPRAVEQLPASHTTTRRTSRSARCELSRSIHVQRPS